MRAVSILRSRLENALDMIHALRREALWKAVLALVVGRRLWLTELGRSRPGEAKKKHQIKAIDRLLGNGHLHAEQPDVYRAITQLLVRPGTRPIIVVDWTPLGNDFHALVASVPIGGRALPLLQQVHPERLLASRKVEKQFLSQLQLSLPADCRPIIVADAGFRSPWCDAVAALGWDFVGRIRGRVLVQRRGDDWMPAKALYAKARPQARCFGTWTVTKSERRKRRLVLVRKKRKPGPKVSKGGQSSCDKKHRKREQEPWLLVTSLGDEFTAGQVAGMYAQRMQIEETFRDEKNPRLGWSLAHARSKAAKRYEVLLLIGALGLVAMTMLGLAAESVGLHWSHQANTTRHRRVLSLIVLAGNVVKAGQDALLPSRLLRQQFESIHKLTGQGQPEGEA